MNELNETDFKERNLYAAYSFDPSVYIKRSINLLTGNLAAGILLAIGVLWLFLRQWRATLIIALAIPVSLLTTFVVLSMAGRSLNVISLAAPQDHWLLRVGFASVFLFHGIGKLAAPGQFAEMMHLPLLVAVLVALADRFGRLATPDWLAQSRIAPARGAALGDRAVKEPLGQRADHQMQSGSADDRRCALTHQAQRVPSTEGPRKGEAILRSRRRQEWFPGSSRPSGFS